MRYDKLYQSLVGRTFQANDLTYLVRDMFVSKSIYSRDGDVYMYTPYELMNLDLNVNISNRDFYILLLEEKLRNHCRKYFDIQDSYYFVFTHLNYFTLKGRTDRAGANYVTIPFEMSEEERTYYLNNPDDNKKPVKSAEGEIFG
jgi:hypothetical protein